MIELIFAIIGGCSVFIIIAILVYDKIHNYLNERGTAKIIEADYWKFRMFLEMCDFMKSTFPEFSDLKDYLYSDTMTVETFCQQMNKKYSRL